MGDDLQAELSVDAEQNTLEICGNWTVSTLQEIVANWRTQLKSIQSISKIIACNLGALDSAGALLLKQIQSFFEKGSTVELLGFSKDQLALMDLVASNHKPEEYLGHQVGKRRFFENVGRETMRKLNQCDGFIILIGDLSLRLFYALGRWRHFQWPSIAANVDLTGIKALPIVGLLSFLIGIVLAYQMGLQLQTYGANIFIAYLSGMAIFREFSPLITAVIVAGRTSSSFTAQIGSMKVNEEVDAINTMGLSTTELLVLPKVLGLLLVFPLLIFWSDVFSILGAMVMSKVMLGVSYMEFLERLKDSVGLQQFMIGLSKAPAFAILIALVGCFQGFLVGFSADSIGKQTTKSVVQAIFLIIVADAIFSVLYSWMGI